MCVGAGIVVVVVGAGRDFSIGTQFVLIEQRSGNVGAGTPDKNVVFRNLTAFSSTEAIQGRKSSISLLIEK